jgi:hypothetical protein
MTQEISAYMEITYSKERKEEMKHIHEENCQLLVNLLSSGLTKNGLKNFKLSIPKNKQRTADIVLEFAVSKEEELTEIEKLVKTIGGKSIDAVSTFILEEA